MSVSVTIQWDKRGIAGPETGKLKSAVGRALRKAGVTALRDMRSEASKRIRARKQIKSKYITRALTLERPRGSDIASMSWALNVSGQPVPLIAYPHRQTRRGVSVEVNTGKQTLVQGAFHPAAAGPAPYVPPRSSAVGLRTAVWSWPPGATLCNDAAGLALHGSLVGSEDPAARRPPF